MAALNVLRPESWMEERMVLRGEHEASVCGGPHVVAVMPTGNSDK